MEQGARLCLPVACAQAALESAWGNSTLTRAANNLFGIKAGEGWRGPVVELPTTEYRDGVPHEGEPARWRAYMSWLSCVKDYSRLISTLPWFRAALNHLDDPDAFLACLLPGPNKPGWATDPNYAQKVRRCAAVIESLGGPVWAKKGGGVASPATNGGT